MRIAVISDLHLGMKDGADDFFNPLLQKQKKLMDLIESDIEIIVVNGDFLDGWENPIIDIMDKYEGVFESIRKRIRAGRKIYFVKGNHDATEDFPFFRKEILTIGNYVFMHGYQLDIFNSKWWGIGWAVTKVGAFIERLGWRDVDKAWSRIGRGRSGTNEQYYRYIMKWVKKNPRYQDKVIVLGHTHEFLSEPKQLTNCVVMNCGTWRNEKMDILYLEEDL